jgi:hypothetical protein
MRHFPAFRRHALAATSVFATLSCCLWAAAGADTPSDGPWNRAKNLARLNCGAHIDRILPGDGIVSVAVATDRNENPAALVLDDNTLSCPLSVGDNTFIVTLPRIAVLERFAFINQNAATHGDFELSVSNYRLGSNDPKWIPVQTSTRFTGQRLVNFLVMGVEAKYVKLSFHVQKEGRLAGIALYGSRTLEGFADRHVLRAQSAYTFASTRPASVTRPEDTLNFNFANRYAHGRVAYVSSGEPTSSPRLIDDDVATSFSFSPRDEHPTLIVELAERQNLHRVSAVYDTDKGQLDVYLLNELPANPGDLRGMKPVASIVDDKGAGQAAVDFAPTNARYVALRWSRAKPGPQPFGVAEVASFSVVPLSVLDLEEAPALADSGTVKPGEGGPDFSNTLGTLADPPTIGPVSP